MDNISYYDYIKKYCKDQFNYKININDFFLENDGDTTFIKKWNLENIEQPSLTDLTNLYTNDDIERDYKFEKLREYRNKLLNDTDIYVLPDYPIDSNLLDEIIAYRQELRDLPATINIDDVIVKAGVITGIDFPIKPVL